jgi:RNA polymerase sigma-B factor
MRSSLTLDREVAEPAANDDPDRAAVACSGSAPDEFAALLPHDPRREQARAELVVRYLPVVQHIARRYRGRGEPLADLEQVATIGLLNALDRFDPHRGVDFLAFAIPTIMGEVRQYFRDHTWATRVPRRLKDMQGPLRDAIGSLSTTLGRAPTPREIASELGVSVDHVIEALNAQQAYSTSPLEILVGDTGTSPADVLGGIDGELEIAQYRHELRRALDDLPSRDRAIVVLRFFGDLTQTQIGARLGLSQMHVSRLLVSSLTTLRTRLDAE